MEIVKHIRNCIGPQQHYKIAIALHINDNKKHMFFTQSDIHVNVKRKFFFCYISIRESSNRRLIFNLFIYIY